MLVDTSLVQTSLDSVSEAFGFDTVAADARVESGSLAAFNARVGGSEVKSVENREITFVEEIVIDEEQACDIGPREALLDAAFGRKERFAKTCQRLREGRVPAQGLALAARRDGDLIGTLRLWHVDAGGVPALLLGPLAVASTHRSFGLGKRLMQEGLARAAALGHRAVILVGDAPYYAQFGFSRAPMQALAMPGPIEQERFLGLEFEPGALAGACGVVKATGAFEMAAHELRQQKAGKRPHRAPRHHGKARRAA